MIIRKLRPTDLEASLAAIAALFSDSVHGLGAAHYSPAQLLAWAPRPPDLDRWREKLAAQHLLLADQDGELIGMLGYELDGHIDVLFTHPDHGRKGVAASLHAEAERLLAEHGVTELFTEASEVARPFFARQGYAVELREEVAIRGVALHRYRMRRRGSPAR